MNKLVVVTLMILIAVYGESYARPTPQSGGGYSPNVPVPPHSVPIHPTYVAPSKDFAELSAERVFNELVTNGLAYSPVRKGEATNEDRFKFKKQIQFRNKEFKGYICEFNSESKLQEAQENALELNDKRIKNNWSISHKNIILVIDGELPENEFLKFQEALRRL